MGVWLLCCTVTSSTFQRLTRSIINEHGARWWEDPDTFFTSIWADGAHPEGAMSGGRTNIEQWAVRRWVSLIEGGIAISGHLSKAITASGAQDGGDGIRGRIIVDGAELWWHDIDGRDVH